MVSPMGFEPSPVALSREERDMNFDHLHSYLSKIPIKLLINQYAYCGITLEICVPKSSVYICIDK